MHTNCSAGIAEWRPGEVAVVDTVADGDGWSDPASAVDVAARSNLYPRASCGELVAGALSTNSSRLGLIAGLRQSCVGSVLGCGFACRLALGGR